MTEQEINVALTEWSVPLGGIGTVLISVCEAL
jgi:hypothetical protein